MRLSFASFTLQPPLLQTSPSPWPPAFPLPLRPLEEEGGQIKPYVRKLGHCKQVNTPSVGLCPPVPPCMTSALLRSTRGAMQDPISPTYGRPDPPAVQLRRQGERCISNDISRYKRKTRVYRMNVCRVGPCVRPQSSCISVGWSLLSKGLRGGMSRSDRVESLLRRMIASEDAKNPLQIRK